MILGEEAQRRSSKRWIPEAAGGAGQQAEEGAGAAGEVAGLEGGTGALATSCRSNWPRFTELPNCKQHELNLIRCKMHLRSLGGNLKLLK